MAQCKAKAKSTQQRCRRRAVTGYEVCVVHGGKTPRGVASPHFKHGRYSKSLPDRLAAQYELARTDPDLVALRDEIALVDTRLHELISALDTGEAGSLWSWLQSTVDDLQEARTKKDQAGLALAINEIVEAVQQGARDQQAWREVYSLLEQRRRLAESERKRLVDLQLVITAEKQMVLLGAVIDTIRRHVEDRRALAAISSDIGRLVSAEPGRTIEATGG